MADFVGEDRPITTTRETWNEPLGFVCVPNPQLNYAQRVFSSGLSAWCYYTKTAPDPNPLPTDTTPNWTGSIMGHQVLSISAPG